MIEALSPKVLNLIKDVVNDPEFRFDHNLTEVGSDEAALMLVLNNEVLLKVVAESLLSDYEHDIHMEMEWECDPTYLIPTRDELKSLVEGLTFDD